MPSGLTSVHTEETPAQLATRLSYGEELRLHYPNEWWATHEAYLEWDLADGGDRTSKLKDCRSYAWFARHKQLGTVKVISSSCRLRWCPLCAAARAGFLASSVRSWYYTARSPKLLTLTMRHSDIPLQDQLDNLYQAFRKLRRAGYMKTRINGGIWFFQIKWSSKTNAWHPHIHALLDGGYVPQAEIRKRWAKYTKGSNIVDIRSCFSPESAAKHVARYATRPGTLNSVPQENRLELLETMHGRRIVGSWGSARKVPLAPPKCDDKDAWTFLGSWKEVHSQAKTSLAAKSIVFAWKSGYTIPRDLMLERIEPASTRRPWMEDTDANVYYSQSIFDP